MSNNQDLYNELRQKHTEFIYSGYELSLSDTSVCLSFDFEIPGLAQFCPKWEIARPVSISLDINDKRLRELVFSLGMVELISYWKTTCAPQVKIVCGALPQEQIGFWKKLYKKGLGEFFFVNGIDAGDDFMTIDCNGKNTPFHCGQIHATANDTPKVLIPIGGGKDSAVTLELLGGCAERFCYMINPRKAMTETVAAADIPDDHIITASRTLDKNMLELNSQGYLNGHTPFSAIVAFSSVIAAYIHGIEYIALSNESSANESTVPGSDVNHQYSKSLEFETDFIEYESKYIASGVSYFSLLRPLTELGIAGIFSRFDKYHGVFRSCNAGSFEDKWCAACPKCLFVYIILAPFLPLQSMTRIFGKDMLADMKLQSEFEKLIGALPEKPFECVGSRDEVNAALKELISQYEPRSEPLPALLEMYKGISVSENHNFTDICRSFDENNHVPELFIPVLRKAVHDI